MSMKAVGLYKYLPIDDPVSLLDVEIPVPEPDLHDLLVRVHAISVNPVDVKQRAPRPQSESAPKILGWDAAGVVEKCGKDVRLFVPGDEVFYAGSIIRPGCNSEYHLVDERIAGKKPKTLDYAQAAALPLTSLTAWEALFDRLAIPTVSENHGAAILIIGGAGGVGSIAIQLAKQVAGLRVIATASRPETVEWCRRMGADSVINYNRPLKEELSSVGPEMVEYIFCCNSLELYAQQFADIIRPQGKICSIVRAKADAPFQINNLMYKSASFVWELMFTRPMFQTADMQRQHDILNSVSNLVDSGVLKTTIRENFGKLNAANLRKAHAKIESGRTIGKIVLNGI